MREGKGDKGGVVMEPQLPLAELRHVLGTSSRDGNRLDDFDLVDRGRTYPTDVRRRAAATETRRRRISRSRHDAAGALDRPEAALSRGPGRSGNQLAARASSRRRLI